MTTDEAKQLQNSIAQLGGSANVTNLIVGKSKSNRPKISRHLKRMTYYRERFALQMKLIIDSMIVEYEKEEFKERFFRYEDYKDTLTKNSLYLKINQAWLYLRNELDTECEKYKRFAELICIVRQKDGIRIRYQKDITDTSELKPISVSCESTQRKTYTEQIEQFLNESKLNEELTITGIVLSEEEQQQVEASICQLENYLYKISSNKIWMVKISE